MAAEGLRGGALIALAGASLLAGCRSPTQIEVTVTTDVTCSSVTGTSFTPGQLGAIELSPSATTSTTCQDGRLGSVVLIPSGDDNEQVAFKVVTAFDNTTVDECTLDAGDAGHCIIARRALRYIPHTTLRVPVQMATACAGNDCGDPTMTCVEGACVPATIPDPSQCEGNGCGEGVLLPDGGVPAEDGGAPVDGSVLDATLQDGSPGDATIPPDAPSPVDGAVDANVADSKAPPFDAGPAFGCDLSGLQAGAYWPMDGYCPTHRARSPVAGPTATPTHSWVVELGPNVGTLDSSPLVAADGTIYVTTEADYVEAISSTGALLWQRSLGISGGQLSAAPALAYDDTLRAIDFATAQYAVQPLDGGAATLRSVGMSSAAELVLVDGGVGYFGEGSGHLVALDGTGAVKWTAPQTSNENDYVAVGAQGLVFTGYSGGVGTFVSGVDSTGSITWQANAPERFTGFAVAADRTVRAVSYDYVAAFDPTADAGPDAGPLWQRWVVQTTGVAVGDDGWAYVGTGTGNDAGSGLFAYDPFGAQTPAPDSMQECGSPLIDVAGNVYDFCDFQIVAYTSHLAKRLWALDVPSFLPAYSNVVASNTLVLGPGGAIYFTANVQRGDGGTLPDGGPVEIVVGITP
jgi:hypothetical protein